MVIDRETAITILTTIILILIFGAIIFGAIKIGSYIEENGLKSILLQIWEGSKK
mgnify:CR=1 FL=1